MHLLKIQNHSAHLPLQMDLGSGSSFNIGVFAKKENRIDYSIRDGSRRINELLRRKAQEMLQENFPQKKVIILNQVHGDRVLDINSKSLFAEADAMCTNDPNFALAIATADCLPIFFIDKKNKTFAACHAGWRGTKKKIAKKTLEMILERYNSKIENVAIYFLPGISKESYEVRADIAEYFPNFVDKKNDKLFLDLVAANIHSLERTGVLSENLYVSPYCTFLANGRFFSHRKGDKGRNLNVIWSASKT